MPRGNATATKNGYKNPPSTILHYEARDLLVGGNAAANAIHEECRAQGVKCCVVGVPKSIDNDILLIDRCFGFETAVAEAKKALLAGKVEASSAYRCVHARRSNHYST